MRMKAAVLYEPMKPLVIEEVELDPPKANEVLVKMVASGVCHTDVHIYTGDSEAVPPVVPGHEGAGVVEEIGPGVTGIKVGDHVILSSVPACGRCHWCHVGHPNMCDLGAKILTGKMLDDTVRLHRASDGLDLHVFLLLSTFAQYSVVPDSTVLTVPSHLPMEKICLLGCGFTTGFGAATNALEIRPGETVTVVGCGGLGLSAIQGARLSGAGKIIAVDLHEEKLDIARNLGATHGIQNRRDTDAVVEEIKEITHGLGTDYSMEFVGADQTDETADIAFRAIRKGGTMLMVGVGVPTKKTFPITPAEMVRSQKTVQGVLIGDTRFRTDIPRYIELFEQGAIDLDSLITREIALEDITDAFEQVLAGNKVARQVIRF